MNDASASRSSRSADFKSSTSKSEINSVEETTVSEATEDRNFDKGIEFLLSCLGLSVGLGNIWRFPTRAYENGGSTFLIAYIICGILFGLPAVYLEFALGQYQGKSPPYVYRRIMPILEGFGWVAAILSTIVGIYYILLISWICIYLYHVVIGNSWRFSECDNEWNNPATCFNVVAQKLCHGDHPVGWNNSLPKPEKLIYIDGKCQDAETLKNITITGATEQFFQGVVIKASTGFTDFNSINYPVLISITICWIMVVLLLLKGMKFIGKVSYVTVTLPYIIIIILLVRGVTLDGASEGITFFLAGTDFTNLFNYETWTAALTQMCFSISIGYGGLMNLASYNKKSHNCYRDAICLIVGDTMMSIIGGTAVFSTLGFLAKHRGVSIQDLVTSGPSLAFVAYPDAMNQMPIPWLWSFLFFIMLFLLGIGSELVLVQVIISCLNDRFPSLRNKKALVVTGISAMLFVIGFVLVTDAGIYWFELFDQYGSGLGAVISVTFTFIIIGYVYGMKNFKTDISKMLGIRRGRCAKIFGHDSVYYGINWRFISPVFGFVLIVLSVWRSYPYQDNPIAYPPIFDILGWTLTFSPFIMIPLCAYFSYRTFKEQGIPTRGLFMLQKTHPSYQRISKNWSEEKREIGEETGRSEPEETADSISFSEEKSGISFSETA